MDLCPINKFQLKEKKLVTQQHSTSNMNLRFMCVSKNIHFVNENYKLTLSLEVGTNRKLGILVYLLLSLICMNSKILDSYLVS